jgi:hypothetical protein
MPVVSQGGTVTLYGSVYTGTGAPANAADLTLTIYDPLGSVVAGFPVAEPAIVHDDLGEYHYHWTAASTAELGDYTATWRGTVAGGAVLGSEAVEVVEAGYIAPTGAGAYGGRPATDIRDEVRFLVGDTKALRPELTNVEINYLLAAESNDPIRAAARAAEMLAAKYTSEADEKRVGPLTLRNSIVSKATRYAKLAKALWSRSSSGSAAPFAGGVSALDKTTRISDPDRVHPAFNRGMMQYPLGSTITAESLLSPSEEIVQ